MEVAAEAFGSLEIPALQGEQKIVDTSKVANDPLKEHITLLLGDPEVAAAVAAG